MLSTRLRLLFPRAQQVRTLSRTVFASYPQLQPPAELDERELHVFKKLTEALEPSRLEVHDVSGGCGSMYAIEIASQRFKGLNMMKQHRMVNEVLAEEIKGWHGVQLKTKIE